MAAEQIELLMLSRTAGGGMCRGSTNSNQYRNGFSNRPDAARMTLQQWLQRILVPCTEEYSLHRISGNRGMSPNGSPELSG
jgi:hypothetical protein